MPRQDRFIVRDEPFSKRGPLRTMPITIGGVPKDKLLEQVKGVRYVSPYAERIMRHENFTTLEKPASALLIVLTPKDFGFTQMAYVADLLHTDRLLTWSKENFDGWEVTAAPCDPIYRTTPRRISLDGYGSHPRLCGPTLFILHRARRRRGELARRALDVSSRAVAAALYGRIPTAKIELNTCGRL